jgi:hypothetical protein
MCLSFIFELRITLKDGVESISSLIGRSELGIILKDGVESIGSLIGQSKTAAAHIARVWGKEREQGT